MNVECEDRQRVDVISPDGQYRYWLEEHLGETGPVVVFVGINPSTADATQDDNTTRRWRGFAERMGARCWVAVNVFALRSTDVGQLSRSLDPVGPDNGRNLHAAAAAADVLVACWGGRGNLRSHLHPMLGATATLLRESGKPLHCYGRTKHGDPKHLLYVPYSAPLEVFA